MRSALNDAIRQDAKLKAAADKFVVLPNPFKRDANYLGFAKTLNMRPFLEQFNKILRDAGESGELQEIINNTGLGNAE